MPHPMCSTVNSVRNSSPISSFQILTRIYDVSSAQVLLTEYTVTFLTVERRREFDAYLFASVKCLTADSSYTHCSCFRSVQTTVESTMEHPFFVYNRGWSSFNPLKTSQRYELRCMQLEVGDRCISLTQKNADLRHSTASSSNRTESKLASSSLSSKLTNAAGSETTRLGRARLASDSAFQFHGKSWLEICSYYNNYEVNERVRRIPIAWAKQFRKQISFVSGMFAYASEQ